MDKVKITKTNYAFEESFLDFTNKNRDYHTPWVSAPKTKKESFAARKRFNGRSVLLGSRPKS